MTETIIKKKEKGKKEYDYEAAVKRLRPFLKLMKKHTQEYYEVLYDEYLECPNFAKLCRLLGENDNTALTYFAYHNMPVKNLRHSEATKEGIRDASEVKPILVPKEMEDGTINYVENETPEVIVRHETDINFAKYQSTYTQLRKIESLAMVDFNAGKDYRGKLVKQLKKSIEHLQQLLDSLEVNLK